MNWLSWVFKFGRGVAGLFTGGTLDGILKTIDRLMDDGERKESLKAEVTKTMINRQADLLVGRTWWFQLFFVIPMAVHWLSLQWVSSFPHWGWTVHPLPEPFGTYEGWIISALFLVDGSKAVAGSVMGVIKK